ncbi:hypothetical protein EB796_024198 [Bugula neritina]|uniref:Uncharacterized protein n=1 Tax=Bugula neritina TaxID=10212 RepID=A0A7J7IU65_BUGNE|nr:hypothetical protein EB796_024198 [Bugula neritina]
MGRLFANPEFYAISNITEEIPEMHCLSENVADANNYDLNHQLYCQSFGIPDESSHQSNRSSYLKLKSDHWRS